MRCRLSVIEHASVGSVDLIEHTGVGIVGLREDILDTSELYYYSNDLSLYMHISIIFIFSYDIGVFSLYQDLYNIVF